MSTPDKIQAPAGYKWLARRLNRHPYHLTKAAELAALCGEQGESMDVALFSFINTPNAYACPACLASAHTGRPVSGGRIASITEIGHAPAPARTWLENEAGERHALPEGVTLDQADAMARFILAGLGLVGNVSDEGHGWRLPGGDWVRTVRLYDGRNNWIAVTNREAGAQHPHAGLACTGCGGTLDDEGLCPACEITGPGYTAAAPRWPVGRSERPGGVVIEADEPDEQGRQGLKITWPEIAPPREYKIDPLPPE